MAAGAVVVADLGRVLLASGPDITRMNPIGPQARGKRPARQRALATVTAIWMRPRMAG